MMEKQISNDLIKKIVISMHKEGMIKTWLKDKAEGWMLADGVTWSPLYLNVRHLSSFPAIYSASIDAMGMLLKNNGFSNDGNTVSVGEAMGGIAISDGLALRYNIPAIYTRKLPEDVKSPLDVDRYLSAHGEKALVEGKFTTWNRLFIASDMVSTFSSKLLTVAQVKNEAKRRGFVEEVNLKHIFSLFEREQGASLKAAQEGYELHSAIGFMRDAFGILRQTHAFNNTECSVIEDFFKNKDKYQISEVQRGLIALARK